MALPKQFMDEIRLRVPLSDVISTRMKLIRAGREFKGCCPFHGEKTPSFTVNNEKGFYHCFGCGVHGDVINFIMQHDNVPFIEAVEYLATQAGMEVPQQSPEDIKRFKQQSSLYELLEITTKWFEDQLRLSKNSKALAYLYDRGLSDETIGRFRLGYAPADSGALYEKLKAAGFSDKDMIDAGAFRKSNYGDKPPYGFFRDRVMFPVGDARGRVVAFGGRILPEAFGGPGKTANSAPKYINTSETPLFHKGKLLYAQSLAREAIREGGHLMVVEGYMDVIGLAQSGFEGAVAPLGTALTENQILELWKMMPPGSKTPLLCFDGDNAGRRAAVRAMERALPILAPDQSLGFVFLPEGQDPDTMVRTVGAEAFAKLLTAPTSLVDLMWNEEAQSRDLSNPEARAGLQANLEQKALDIADRHVQQFYLREIRDRVYKAFSYFKAKGSGKGQSNYKNNYRGGAKKDAGIRPHEVRTSAVVRSKFTAEHILLSAMVNHPKLLEEFEEQLGMMDIDQPELDSLRQALLGALEEVDLDHAKVLEILNNAGQGQLLGDLLNESLYSQAGFVRLEQPYDLVREAWLFTWQRKLMKQRTA